MAETILPVDDLYKINDVLESLFKDFDITIQSFDSDEEYDEFLNDATLYIAQQVANITKPKLRKLMSEPTVFDIDK